ncbi:MAG: hypothetical protein M3406_07640 [Chloroflexota bacterium]|nr:hypothetical protein [Chloroflexota bacterium]
MSGQRHLGASLALVSVLLLGACSLDGAGDVPAAREIVREYLVALAGESPDRGWSLILPDSRRAHRDQDEYLGLVESVLLTVRLDDDPASEGNAELIVYFGQFGERGILLGGG